MKTKKNKIKNKMKTKKNIKFDIKLKSLKKNKKKIVLRTNLILLNNLLNKFNPAITNPASINSIIIKPTSFNPAITNPASIIIK